MLRQSVCNARQSGPVIDEWLRLQKDGGRGNLIIIKEKNP